ncbi:MAG: galactokinase [Chloroflexota bacterium]
MSADNRTNTLIEEFQKRFHSTPSQVAIAPGRVNLIGEHTDYNDGFVLPIALQRDVRIVMAPREDRTIRLFSLEYDSTIEFSLDQFKPSENLHWGNYIKGVAWSLQEEGLILQGFDGVISGNVPRGSGLSSSAALEVACGQALLSASGLSHSINGPRLAQIAQRAENKYVGVNCGIMDQFISVLGAVDQALLIDCRSLDYRLVSMPTDVSIVIGNTKASRSLADSAYNERRSQCEEGVAILQTVLPHIQALRDVSAAELEEHQSLLPSPVIYQRCHHVVTENERVLYAVDALEEGDLNQVGQLMNQSHASLRDDYQVSSNALDIMVELMSSIPGCYGARLTGAGFGGCAIALVKPGTEQAVADAIYDGYPKVTQIWPEVYTTQASSGSRVEEL